MDNDLSKAPYYAIKIGPGIHYTMGGVKINTNTEVLDKDGKPITGLFAAGRSNWWLARGKPYWRKLCR